MELVAPVSIIIFKCSKLVPIFNYGSSLWLKIENFQFGIWFDRNFSVFRTHLYLLLQVLYDGCAMVGLFYLVV